MHSVVVDDYSLINYGIGGQIEIHVDYWNALNKEQMYELWFISYS